MKVQNAEIITTEKQKPKPKTAASVMGEIVNAKSTQQLLKNALKENSGAFAASIIDLYNSDTYLQACDPRQVFGECLKAVSLKLPINKQLGFAYVIAYKGVPQFQIGYKGLIQLALRTGAYKHINADVVYEGEFRSVDKLTGEVDISGEATSDTAIGYFAYIETTNGFKKALYWSKEKIVEHAKKFSKSYNSANSVWKSNFDAMAIKTVLRNLLIKYGYMSIEMMNAYEAEENAGTAAEVMTSNSEEVVETEATTVTETTEEKPSESATSEKQDPYPFD